MGRARNLANLKPNAQGLIEADDIAPGAIQVDSSALVSQFPLASGTTSTALRGMFIDLNGEIGRYPVASTITQTLTDVSNNTNYGGINMLEGRVSIEAVQGSGPNWTLNVRVYNGTSYPSSPTFTYNINRSTIPNAGTGPIYNLEVVKLSETQGIFRLLAYTYNASFTFFYQYDLLYFTVNPSTGALTIGTRTQPVTSNTSGVSLDNIPIGGGAFVWRTRTNGVSSSWNYVYPTSGATTASSTVSGSFFDFSSGLFTSARRIGNRFFFLENQNIHTFVDSGGSLSGYSVSTLPTSIRTPGVGNSVFGFASDTVGYCIQQSTTGQPISINTFTIDSSAGTIAYASSGSLTTGVVTLPNGSMQVTPASVTQKDANRFALSLQNSTGQGSLWGAVCFRLSSSGIFQGSTNTLLLNNVLYNGYYWSLYGVDSISSANDNFRFVYRADYDATLRQVQITVPQYDSNSLAVLGIAKTSASSGNVDVFTTGVVSGFTGLTPGSLYYINTSLNNGTLTTNPGGAAVGYALSTTQMRRV